MSAEPALIHELVKAAAAISDSMAPSSSSASSSSDQKESKKGTGPRAWVAECLGLCEKTLRSHVQARLGKCNVAHSESQCESVASRQVVKCLDVSKSLCSRTCSLASVLMVYVHAASVAMLRCSTAMYRYKLQTRRRLLWSRTGTDLGTSSGHCRHVLDDFNLRSIL